MNLNQYTVKSQEAIQAAQQVAMEFGNQQIEPQHLLEGIFQVDENISPFLLKKSEALILVTNHREFEILDGDLLKKYGIKVVIDGKNFLDKRDIQKSGVLYKGIGR